MVDFVTGYMRRIVDDELDAVRPQLPAVLLDGPKGVGKTETALQRAETVWRLDDRAHLAIAEADPSIVVTDTAPVLLDGTHGAVRGKAELTVRDYVDEIVRSGFPGMRALSGRALRTRLDGYVDRIIDRDVPEAGHELRTSAGDVVAIGVKLSATIDDDDVRHLNWLETRIGDRLLDKVVLSTGPLAYRRPDGVAVVPLSLLGP